MSDETTEAPAAPPVPDLSRESAGGWEWLLIAVLAAAATAYLARQFFSRRNAGRCASCGQTTGCSAARIGRRLTAPPPKDEHATTASGSTPD